MNIKEEIESIQKLIDKCKQQMIEITGIPNNKLNKEKNYDILTKIQHYS